MIEQILQRLKLVFSWGKITRADWNELQVEFPTGDLNERIKHLHQYGFLSRAKPNATAYCLFIGGDRSNGFAFLTEDKKYQIELQDGEVAIMDNKNNLIHLTSNGIKIKTSSKVTLDASDVDITGNLTVGGNVETSGNIEANGNVEAGGDVQDMMGSMQDIRTAHNSHTHTGNVGAPTSPPLTPM